MTLNLDGVAAWMCSHCGEYFKPYEQMNSITVLDYVESVYNPFTDTKRDIYQRAVKTVCNECREMITGDKAWKN